MSTAPLKNVSVPSRRERDAHGRRVRQPRVAAAVPHAGDADAAPVPRRARVMSRDARQRRVPVRLQGIEALRQAGRVREHLARRRDIAVVQRIEAPDGPAVEPQPLGQIVHQRLVGDGGLRHAEAAEGAGRRVVGVDGARGNPRVGHLVGPHAVHRHAVGHRRPPRRVGAGIEVGPHLEGGEPALCVGRRLGPDARRMPLGGGGHGFRARVDDAHRTPGHPRRHRQQRLDRHVELAAEAAAAGGRADAHARGVDAQHARRLLAVHVGRLRAGRDLDAIRPVADGHRVAGLRLDVGVLDEGGLEVTLGRRGRVRVPGPHVAAPQVAARQHVVRNSGVDRWRPWGQRSLDPGQRRLRCPGDRQVDIADAFDRRPRADQRQHGLAAEAHRAGRQHRLVLGIGEDAERVLARHVVRGEDRHQARGARLHRREIAEREARAGVRRAHHAHPQRVGGGLVGAEPVGAGHLGPAVDAWQAGADGRKGSARRGQTPRHNVASFTHRIAEGSDPVPATSRIASTILR